jgi:hypothetical protein
LKPVFEIIPEAIFFNQTTLVCEISLEGFTYVFKNDIEKKFKGLSHFQFNKADDVSDQLAIIFEEQPLLRKSYNKVFVSYTCEESVLIPSELYKSEDNELLLSTLYGDIHQGRVAIDHLVSKNIYNVYRIPVALSELVARQFSLADFEHHYSLLVKQSFKKDNLTKLIFYRDTFIAVLVKEGELQLINTYRYQSGTDVVYHLMNIFDQFTMTNVSILIGGMIEVSSDLHKELNHYFQKITFDELPTEYEYDKCLKELPPHYFSYLFSQAICV